MPKARPHRNRRLAVREDLSAIIATIPPPSAPLVFAHEDQVRGLSLLDAGLRLSHITRVTESLAYAHRGSLSRSVSADIDLTLLPGPTLEILGDWRSRTVDGTPRHWIPVARHSRVELSSVDVSLNNGDLLPRLPQRDCSELLAVALLRILRMTMAASMHASTVDSEVYRALNRNHRSVWTLEKAISQYVHQGGSEGQRALALWADDISVRDPRATAPSAPPEDHPESIRQRAMALMGELFPDPGDPFFELVKVAAGDHLLVVGIPAVSQIVQVRYEAPLLRAHAPNSIGRASREMFRGLVPSGADFVLDYETTIPRHARSFHLDVSVDPDITIRSCVMSSDDDAPDLQEFTRAVDALADAAPKWSPHVKIVEHELQVALMRLSGLLERRSAELVSWLRTRGVTPQSRKNRLLRHENAEGSPWRSQRSTLRNLLVAARRQQLGELAHLTTEPGFSEAEELQRLSQRVQQLEVGWSAMLDNDARDQHAHVHWTPKISVTRPGSATIHARLRVVLADEKPALAESVRAMIFGLAGIVYLLGYVDSHTWLWFLPWHPHAWAEVKFSSFGQADAVIAVLLVVPGILVGRLDLPHPDTVLGQLRLFPRRLAYLAVITTTVLGVAIAGGVTTQLKAWMISGFLALLFLGALCHLDLWFRAVRRKRSPLPAGGPIPRWLALATRRHLRLRPGDAHFSVNSERVAPRSPGAR